MVGSKTEKGFGANAAGKFWEFLSNLCIFSNFCLQKWCTRNFTDV